MRTALAGLVDCCTFRVHCDAASMQQWDSTGDLFATRVGSRLKPERRANGRGQDDRPSTASMSPDDDEHGDKWLSAALRNYTDLDRRSDRMRTRSLQHEDAARRQRLAARAREHEARKKHRGVWYILRPDQALITAKDSLSFVALVLLYFTLPYELGFMDLPLLPDPSSGLFIFNRVIDVIFGLDILLQFFVAIPKTSDDDFEAADEALRDGDIIRPIDCFEFRPSKIAMHYLTSWLLIDVAAMVPSAFEIYFANLPRGELGSSKDGMHDPLHGQQVASLAAEANASSWQEVAATLDTRAGQVDFMQMIKLFKLMRATRLVRILRLLRLLSAAKILSRMCANPDSHVVQLRDTIVIETIMHARKIRVLFLIGKGLPNPTSRSAPPPPTVHV